ncbi:MAG: metal-dependent transcriptional regulator [Eubacteriales bacterium]|nr:metal-dependent transcriptional regulator [Eubacteriales bacterium]
MIIQEAAEMYLETILVLSQTMENVRSIDVATRMGYSRPTISEKMKQLRQNGYITMNESGAIALTPTGRRIAGQTYERHNLLTRLLTGVGVSEETAAQDACRIEHYISDETFARLKEHLLRIEKKP